MVLKVKDILNVLTFNNNVAICEFKDKCTEFYKGPKELVPDALHECEIEYIYVFDNMLQICLV